MRSPTPPPRVCVCQGQAFCCNDAEHSMPSWIMEHDFRHDDLLQQLKPVVIEIGSETLELLALPERIFHAVTGSSKDDNESDKKINDGTGTRPYSASHVFLYFLKTYFKEIFVKGSAIELGAGIGPCGIYLFKLRQELRHSNLQLGSNHPDQEDRIKEWILLTDGESLTVEILRRNVLNLVMGKASKTTCCHIGVQRLLWSRDKEKLADQLDDINDLAMFTYPQTEHCSLSGAIHGFDFVIGTDLLYYQTDAEELLATVHALLHTSRPGLAFLPGLVRVPELSEKLQAACESIHMDLMVLDVTKFISETELEGVVGWYNIQFFVLKHSGRQIPSSWQNALDDAGCRPFSLETGDNENELGVWN